MRSRKYICNSGALYRMVAFWTVLVLLQLHLHAQTTNTQSEDVPPPGSFACSSEGGTCSITQPSRVYFGANGGFISNYFTNTMSCTLNSFQALNSGDQDPAVGTVKTCFVLPNGQMSDAPAGYTLCATGDLGDGEGCFNETSLPVLYGALGSFASTNATGNVTCAESSFGSDPRPGIIKGCYIPSTTVLQNGLYQLVNIGSQLALEGQAGGSGSAVTQDYPSQSAAQSWMMLTQADGLYAAVNAQYNLSLDNECSGNQSSFGARQWTSSIGNVCQEWYVLDTFVPGMGSAVALLSESASNNNNLLALTVAGGSSSPSNVDQESLLPASNNYQLWMPQSIFTEGIYELQNQASSEVLEVYGQSDTNSGNVDQWPANDGTNQKWVFIAQNDGYFTVVNFNSGLCLSNNGWSTQPGASLIQYDCLGQTNQEWLPSLNGDSSVILTNRFTGQALDVVNGGADQGDTAIQSTPTGSASQNWTPVLFNDQTMPEGEYVITNQQSGLCLDNPNSSSSPGQILDQNTCDSGDEQKWLLRNVTGAYYAIVDQASGLVLDNQYGSSNAGNPIQQYDFNGTSSQLWILLPNQDGTFRIMNKGSGLILQANDNGANAGSTISQGAWTQTSSGAISVSPWQEWNLLQLD